MNKQELINKKIKLEAFLVALNGYIGDENEWLDIYSKSYDIDPCLETIYSIDDINRKIVRYKKEINKTQNKLEKIKYELERQGE